MKVSEKPSLQGSQTEKKIQMCLSTQKISRFEIWISRHFVTKNNLWGITTGQEPLWGINSVTSLSSLDGR